MSNTVCTCTYIHKMVFLTYRQKIYLINLITSLAKSDGDRGRDREKGREGECVRERV